jgi:LCP family protein required for cell wall assembly
VSTSTRQSGRLPLLLGSLLLGVALILGGVSMRGRQQQTIRAAAIAATQTAVPTDASIQEPSATPTETDPLATPTPSDTPTGTLPPTQPPTSTPTALPTPRPPATLPIEGTYPTPKEPAPTAIPPPADPIPVPEGVVNIMLLGSDKRPNDSGYRTDTIIIVSINREEGTVSLLSIPRDMYVYIPGWTMNRINTADSYGNASGWPGGGPGMLKETLLYNFGIQVHYYARVDFDGFKQIVDTLGGIEVPVDCAMQDWRLKEPDLDIENPDNWERYTIPVGVHHMDGELALWYARSRLATSDYDRTRRQQQILRAIWAQGNRIGVLPKIPQLWNEFSEVVETDMGLGNILQLAPLGTELDTSRIRSYFMGWAVTSWEVPDNGAHVLLPIPDEAQRLAALAVQPPAANYAEANTARVEVRNGTRVDRLDEVAADRLGWEGLITVPTGAADRNDYAETVIYDFTGRQKASQRQTLQHILRVADGNVIVQPDPNRTIDYLVILGEDYRSCTYNLPTPRPTATPGPTSTPTPG